METTARLGLPLLVAGQVQKEMFHNEALVLIDLLIGGAVEGGMVSAPPPSPALGSVYRVAPTGTSGVFVGHEDALAGWTAGGWRFVVPVEGMRVAEKGSGQDLAFRNGGWTNGSVRASEVVVNGLKVVGDRAAAIADASGGSVIDGQARAALSQVLAALRSHGLIAP